MDSQQYYSFCALNITSIIALIVALFTPQIQGEQQKHYKFVSFLLKADLVWCILELITQTLFYFTFNIPQLLQFFFGIIEDFIWLIDTFTLNFSFTQMTCIAYTLYYESSSITFSLERSYNGLINKSIIVSFITTIMILFMSTQTMFYYEFNFLITIIYFILIVFYYAGAVRSMMNLGLGLKLGQFKAFSMFPLIFILFQLIPTFSVFINKDTYAYTVIIRQLYAFFDALTYGFLISSNQKNNNDCNTTDTDELTLDFNDIDD